MAELCQMVVEMVIKCLADGSAEDEGTRDAGPLSGDFQEQSEQVIPGTVRMFSGCQDAQTSADVFDTSTFDLPDDAGPGGAGGACTNSMLSTLLGEEAEANGISWLKLLEGMRVILSEKNFTQIPQLSASRALDLNEPFTLDNPAGAGRKRALLIGINYVGQQGELRGCHNDVHMMQGFIESRGFEPDNMRVLMDDGEHDEPTLANILAGFAWLTDGAEAGDSLFLHYSGHGGSVRDANGDEKDGRDETLIPLDYRTNGQLSDDIILANLVLEVPREVMLTAVIDACHSGTVLDLPYKFVADSHTLEEVEAGTAPSMMGANPTFSMAQFTKIGSLLMEMHSAGKSKTEIAQAIISQFPGVLPSSMGSLSSQLASFGF